MRGSISRTLLLATACSAALAQNYAIQTVAGSYNLGNGGPAAQALLFTPLSVTVDRNGNVYIRDVGQGVRIVGQNGQINAFSSYPANVIVAEPEGTLLAGGLGDLVRIGRDGQTTRLAGSGALSNSGDGGPAIQAGVGLVGGIARLADGTIYFSDSLNHSIRRITPAGIISTIAGGGGPGFVGDNNSEAARARMSEPGALALDSSGNLLFADFGNSLIRRIDTQGRISTFAGDGFFFFPDQGPARASSFGDISGLTFDSQGNLLVVDSFFNRLMRISPDGILSFVAGTGDLGFAGDGEPPLSARFFSPVSVSTFGPIIYIADRDNHRIRKIESNITSTFAGRVHFDGDGGPATRALIDTAQHVAQDGQGNIYISDNYNSRIRRVTPTGTISTFAGTGVFGFAGDGGPATAARMSYPGPILTDGSGNVIFADTRINRIRRIAPDGTIRTIVGNGTRGDRAEGVPGPNAQIGIVGGMALDASGVLYFTDSTFHKVRKLTADGTVSTVAGATAPPPASATTGGFAGDGGLATSARFNRPEAIAVERDGSLLVGDSRNGRIRRITAAGTISTIAGSDTIAAIADGASATAQFLGPILGLATDANGYIIASLSAARRIIRIANGRIAVIAGNGTFDPIDGTMSDGGPALNAGLWAPSGLYITRDGDIVFADSDANRIRRLALNNPTTLELISGNNQSGFVGQALAQPLVVRLNGRVAPIPGATVNFAVTTGEARLAVNSTTTDSQGRAGIQVTLGARPGPVRVTATVQGLTPVNFDLTANAVLITPPQISAVQAATLGSGPLAPFGLAIITGSGMAADATNVTSSAKFAPVLGGTCVTINGERVPLGSVTPTQILFQVPALATGAGALIVTRNCETAADAVPSREAAFDVAESSPEFYYWLRNPGGRNPVAAYDPETNAAIGPEGLLPDRVYTPAKPGATVAISANGFGAKTTAIPAGDPSTDSNPTALPVTVKLGDIDLAPENIIYAGASAGVVGGDLLVIRVPEDAPDGEHTLVVTVGSASSPSGGFLTVKKPADAPAASRR